MQQTAPNYTSRAELTEAGSESGFAGWSSRNHIQVGFNTVIRATRPRPERERNAIRWLAAYAQREQITADALTEQLVSDRATIRAALTNPDADVKQLVGKIESLRAVLDSNLRPPADTTFCKTVNKALRFALDKGQLVEIIAKTRDGKTTPADYFHLKNLHQCIYFVCPATESYSDFIFAIARACGVSVGNGKTVTQIEAQIRAMFGRLGIRMLICDEGHNLWPSDITLKPKRIEFLRTLWDENKRQIGVGVLSTPQALVSSNQALQKSKRWSPGQWEGRVTRFRPTAAATSEDIEKVAKWHCPEGNVAIINQLVLFAKVASGFYGAMVNVIERARFEAEEVGEKLTLDHIKFAQAEAIKDTNVELDIKKARKA
jgi:hypothetical protein